MQSGNRCYIVYNLHLFAKCIFAHADKLQLLCSASAALVHVNLTHLDLAFPAFNFLKYFFFIICFLHENAPVFLIHEGHKLAFYSVSLDKRQSKIILFATNTATQTTGRVADTKMLENICI